MKTDSSTSQQLPGIEDSETPAKASAAQRFCEWVNAEESALPLRAFEMALAVATVLRFLPLLLNAGEWLTPNGFHLGSAVRSPAMPPALGPVPAVLLPVLAFGFLAALLSVLAQPRQRWAQAILGGLVLYTVHLTPWLAGAADSLLAVGWLVLASSAGAYTDSSGQMMCAALPRRLLQVSLVLCYFGAGVAKVAHGGWLTDGQTLWALAQGPNHTAVAAWMLRSLPLSVWTLFQGVLLLWELGSPLWLDIEKHRGAALKALVGYHLLHVVLFAGSWPLALVSVAFAVLWLRGEELRVFRRELVLTKPK